MANAKEWSRRSEIYGQAGSGAAGNLKTPVIDMTGAESVMFIAGATVTSTGNFLKMRMGTASASGNMSDATGVTEHTSTGALYLDVQKPTKQFVQGLFSASGATSPHRFIVGIKYGLRSQPSTHPVTTVGKRLYSPGSGTATG